MMLQTTSPAAEVLLAEVDQLAGYVRRRVLDPDEVDEALQAIRVQVWRSADRFDPALGEPAAFVFGIAAKVTGWHRAGLAHRRARDRRFCSSHPIDDHGGEHQQGRAVVDVYQDRTTVNDPLEVLLAAQGPGPWLQVVADAATGTEWRVIVALARYDGDQVQAAAALEMPVRTLRAARDRVQALALAARAAQVRADEGRDPQPAGCVPRAGGLREMTDWLTQPTGDIAAGLGISPGTVRNRRALSRRALEVATQVADASAPSGR